MRLVFSHVSTSASPEMRNFRNFTRPGGSSSSDDSISRSSGVGGQVSDIYIYTYVIIFIIYVLSYACISVTVSGHLHTLH